MKYVTRPQGWDEAVNALGRQFRDEIKAILKQRRQAWEKRGHRGEEPRMTVSMIKALKASHLVRLCGVFPGFAGLYKKDPELQFTGEEITNHQWWNAGNKENPYHQNAQMLLESSPKARKIINCISERKDEEVGAEKHLFRALVLTQSPAVLNALYHVSAANTSKYATTDLNVDIPVWKQV